MKRVLRKSLSALLSVLLVLSMYVTALPVMAQENESISEIEITVSEPKGSMTPDFDPQIPEDADYEIVSVKWQELPSETELTAESIFTLGVQYEIFVELTPKDGYVFADDIVTYMNGDTAGHASSGDYFEVSYFFAPADEVEMWTYEDPQSGFSYYVSLGNAVIDEYIGNESEVVIPATINEHPVNGLSSYAFFGKSEVVSVTIPATVTYISNRAFEGSGIVSLTIPGSVDLLNTTMFTFEGEQYNFETEQTEWISTTNDTLTSLVLEDGIHQIYDKPLRNCTALTEVTIPASVVYISDDAFEGCTALRDVYFEGSDSQWAALNIQDPILLNATVHFGSNAFDSRIDDETGGVIITGYSGENSEQIYIPSSIDGKPVTAIGESVFENQADMYFVQIPATVVRIGANAFFGCNALTEVHFEGTEAQWNTIEIAEPNDELAQGFLYVYGEEEDDYDYSIALYNENLVWIGLYKGTDSVVEIPQTLHGHSVGVLDEKAFAGREDIVSVSIPYGVMSIQQGVFMGCSNLSEISIPASVQYIGDMAFEGTSITELTIPYLDRVFNWFTHEEWTEEGSSYTENDTLNTVILESGTEEIHGNSFRNCTALTSITLPSTVRAVYADAFVGCSALTTVYYNGSEVSWNNIQISSGNEALLNAEIVYNQESDENGLIYEIDSAGNAWVVGYSGESGEVNIPDSYESHTVVGIGQYAFENHSEVTSVTIPNTVTEDFGYCAFRGTGITELTIPGSITYVSTPIFSSSESDYNRTLTSAVFEEGVEQIYGDAFRACAELREVTLPGSLTFIGDYAFRECDSLTDVYFSGSEDEWNRVIVASEQIRNAIVHCSESVFETEEDSSGNITITGYTGNQNLITIPATFEGKPVVAIGAEAFAGVDLAAIYLPASITSIGADAFSQLYEAHFDGTEAQWNGVAVAEPNEVLGDIILYLYGEETDEYDYAVLTRSNEASLTKYKGTAASISVPEQIHGHSVTQLNNVLFSNRENLLSVVIPEGVRDLYYGVFRNCTNLTQLVLPSTLIVINESAFEGCSSLKDITLPENVQIIGDQAFAETGISELALPGTVYEVNRYFTVSVWNEEEGNHYTENNTLSSVEIKYGTRYINSDAFKNCRALTSITIPSTVQEIHSDAFAGCSSLTQVYYEGSESNWNSIRIDSGNEIFLGANIEFALEDDPSGFLYTVNSEGNAVITGYSGGLSEVEIPETIGGYTVTEIAERAFENRSDLTSIGIPDTVTRIGYCAFRGSGITELTIPGSVLNVNASLFTQPDYVYNDNSGYYEAVWNEENSTLTSVVFEEGVLFITQSFRNCTALSSVTIPAGLYQIYEAFEGCTALTDVYYGGSSSDWTNVSVNDTVISGATVHFAYTDFETVLDEQTGEITITGYNHDKDWTRVVIPSQINGYPVTAIGDGAFSGLAPEGSGFFDAVCFPSTIRSIGENAFENCGGITRFYYDGEVEEWDEILIAESNTALLQRLVPWSDGSNWEVEIWFTGDPYDYCLIGTDGFALQKYKGTDTQVTVPAEYRGHKVTTLGWDSFQVNENITSVLISEGIRVIDSAFYNCSSLESVILPDSVQTIYPGTFIGTAISSFTFPDRVRNIYPLFINEYAAYDEDEGVYICSENNTLESVVLGRSAEYIEENAFHNCKALKTITIPDIVQYIGRDAFAGCDSLETVYYGGSPALWDTILISTGNDILNNVNIVYAREDTSEFLYRVTPLDDIIIAGYTGTDTDLVIPAKIDGYNVAEIGEGAFEQNTDIRSLEFEGMPATIGMAAFYGCTSLETVKIPEGLNQIGPEAFENCTSLRTVYLPSTLLTVAPAAFLGCTALEDVYYGGTSEQYESVRVMQGNEPLENATFHFGSSEMELPAPEMAAVSNVADGITVSWGEVAEATEYRIYRKAAGETGFAFLTSTPDSSYTDKSVQSAVQYFYSVRAEIPGIALSEFSDEKSITRLNAPSITAENASGGVKLSWAAVDGAVKYYIYRRGPGETGFKLLASTTNLTYTNSGAVSGNEYRYSVRAYAEDQTLSAFAPGKTVFHLRAPAITVTQSSSTEVKVAWDAVSGAAQYRVLRKAPGETSWKALETVSDPTFTDKTVEAGKNYTYSVRSVSSDGKTLSVLSGSKSITVLAAPVITVENALTGIKVSWAKVDGAVKYNVYRRGPSDSGFKLLASAEALNYTDTETESGTEYRYSVRALDAAGNISSYAAGKTLLYVQAPTITVENTTTGVKVSWSAIEGAAKYYIYRKGPGDTGFKLLSSTTALNYTNKGVESGNEYRYSVRAIDANGGGSTYAAGKTLRYMKAPTFTAESTTEGVKLTWSEVPGTSKYYIYRKGPGETGFSLLASTANLTYTNKGVTSGNDYRYSVRAVPASGAMSAFAPGITVSYMKAPTITVENTSAGVKISWTKITGAAKYYVYRKGPGESGFTKIAGAVGTTLTDKTAEAGKEYRYSVRAVNSDATVLSAYSAGQTIVCKK